MNSNTPSIIILAAGSSLRLGTPKQSLSFRGTTLLRHTAEAALQTSANVLVVVGANKEVVEAELNGLEAKTILNAQWEEGMASSIRAGISELKLTKPEIGPTILCVCDQPFVSAELFSKLVFGHEQSGKGIIACAYGDTLGTPVLFDSNYFEHLMNLRGQQGARKLIDAFQNDVFGVEFAKGVIDIDTIEDYQRLKNMKDL